MEDVSSTEGRDESGVTQNGRSGFVRHVGRLRLSALKEATNPGMSAHIWECVVAGR